MNATTEHAAIEAAAPRNIHTAMIAAMRDIGERGIAKMSKANLGGSTVAFRGIEVAMNEMVAVFVRHGITVAHRYSDLAVTERAKAEAGKFTRFCTLLGTFTFSAEDGSNVTCSAYGEAMDSGDKCVVKAQSIAFRTALFQSFVVPTAATAMDTEVDEEEPDLPEDALLAAESGTETYQAFWKKATLARKREIGEPAHERLKAIATKADGAAR